jgi:hypothetical protein
MVRSKSAGSRVRAAIWSLTPNGPNISQFEWSFLTDLFSFVPELTAAGSDDNHDMSSKKLGFSPRSEGKKLRDIVDIRNNNA